MVSTMDTRTLGRTGLKVSALGFGCGNVGGLMVRGTPDDRTAAIDRAFELGVTYFDTAWAYGNGQSEINLGASLRELGASPVVGTKIRLEAADFANLRAAVMRKARTGVRRLGMAPVDILYLHNQIASGGGGDGTVTAEQARGPIFEALDDVRKAGLARFVGFTGLGETSAVLEVVDSGVYDAMQTYFNAVNPSAAIDVGPGLGGQDLGRMMLRAAEKGTGIVAIRVLAAGALTGAAANERGALAGSAGGAIIRGGEYDADRQRAARLVPIAEEAGITLGELAVRFAVSCPNVGTALVGMSSLDQFEQAAQAALHGELAPAFVDDIVQAAGQG
jgi:L-galactose dehydrogenase/L-glyceraldehyde 3-phosphate reductase